MNVQADPAEVRCYVCVVTINHNDINYQCEVELYRYGGGLEEGDMEFSEFSDENGNSLDESLIDRSIIFQECLKMC